MTTSTQIIIVGYRGTKWLPECLQTLAKDFPSEMHVLLVDNGGENEIDTLPIDALPCTVLTTPRPMGFAEANNFGLLHGGLDAQATCFLNQDTRSSTGWLRACVDCLEQDHSIGAVTPILKTYDWQKLDPAFESCARRSETFQGQLEDGNQPSGFFEIPDVTAAAMVVRTDVLQAVGPFDPIYGSYYEDYDLCLRIRRAGFRVGICADATVAHYSGSATTTPQAKRKRMRQIIRNRAILRIRSSANRVSATLREFGPQLGWNLCRGVWRTPSSQPLAVQLAAHVDLLSTARRLLSDRFDHSAWLAYLEELGWPRQNVTTKRNHAHPTSQ